MSDIGNISDIKGFMPDHEGKALMSWAEYFSKIGPLLEIGSFCGKSSIYIGLAAKKNNQVLYTIDHHKGSEEHQLNEEYFDEEIYDHRVNVFCILIVLWTFLLTFTDCYSRYGDFVLRDF